MTNKIVPALLKTWLTFLLVFLVLGYDIIPSIGFGAIAGLAGGLVSAWWVTPGGEPREIELPAPIQALGRQLRQTPERLPLGGFFRRGNRRSPSPRR
ncbi:MAG TPA: hypothetical protein IGR64_08210 [Leptolyngbyaceae cyanobacterium M65_K2018_010]|nr:hypothetical protein [Leptolyngbyaceae cyanobacterium M65_K2018_010]